MLLHTRAMIRRAALLALGLAGCAAGPSAPAAPTTPATAADATTPYRLLFEQGRTWTYAGTSEASYMDDADPAADPTSGMVRKRRDVRFACTVASVTAAAFGKVAEITCTSPGDDVPVAGSLGGYFTATDDGLWFTATPPTAADLSPETMAMGPAPAPSNRSFEERDGSAGWSRELSQRADGAWCAAASSWSGDDGGVTHCVRADVGLIGGEAYFGGGSVITLTYEVAP